MALTQAQIDAARTLLNQQWGDSVGSDGVFHDGSVFTPDGVYDASNDNTNWGVLGIATQKGWTTDDLSQILGVSPTAITSFVNNFYQNTDPTNAQATGAYTSGATGASAATRLDTAGGQYSASGAAGMFGDDPTTYSHDRLGATDYASLGYLSPETMSRYQSGIENGWYNPQTDSRYAIFGPGGSGVTGYQSVLNPYAQLPDYLRDSTSYQPTSAQINEWRAAHPGASYMDTIMAMRAGQAGGAGTGQQSLSAPSGTSSYPTFSNQQIQAWFAANPGATDLQIAQAMQQFHITPEQLSGAISVPVDQITARFNAALGTGGSGTGGGGSSGTSGGGAGGSSLGGIGGAGGPLAGGMGGLSGTGGTGGLGGIGGGLGGIGGFSFSSSPFSTGTAPTYTSTLGAAPTLREAGSDPNPFLAQQADEIARRSNLALQEDMNGIRSNSIGIGGLGGSRQGVAQGIATGRAMDSLQGNLANLYGTDYTNQQNRNLQQYGQDSSNYNAQRAADLQKYGLDLSQYNTGRAQDLSLYGINAQAALGLNGQNNQFYTANRGQDLQQLALGAQLYGMGNTGYLSQGQGVQNLGNAQQTAPYQNLSNYSNILNQFTGFGSQNINGTSGGGALGALGGAWAGAQLGNLWQQPTNFNGSYSSGGIFPSTWGLGD
jgi:hypothetical protein